MTQQEPVIRHRAVLFDLDGTLLNTLEDLAIAVNRGLSSLGFPQHPAEKYKYFIGWGREEMVAKAIPQDHRDSMTIERAVEICDIHYAQHWADNTSLYPGISEMLDELASRSIKMSILSNKPHDFTVSMVKRFLANWKFESVRGAAPGVPHKPDPTAAGQIAGEMKICPGEFLYLGDSDIDMQTAVNAGMYPVGALWGFRTASELKAGGAAALIARPLELLGYL